MKVVINDILCTISKKEFEELSKISKEFDNSFDQQPDKIVEICDKLLAKQTASKKIKVFRTIW